MSLNPIAVRYFVKDFADFSKEGFTNEEKQKLVKDLKNIAPQFNNDGLSKLAVEKLVSYWNQNHNFTYFSDANLQIEEIGKAIAAPFADQNYQKFNEVLFALAAGQSVDLAGQGFSALLANQIYWEGSPFTDIDDYTIYDLVSSVSYCSENRELCERAETTYNGELQVLNFLDQSSYPITPQLSSLSNKDVALTEQLLRQAKSLHNLALTLWGSRVIKGQVQPGTDLADKYARELEDFAIELIFASADSSLFTLEDQLSALNVTTAWLMQVSGDHQIIFDLFYETAHVEGVEDRVAKLAQIFQSCPLDYAGNVVSFANAKNSEGNSLLDQKTKDLLLEVEGYYRAQTDQTEKYRNYWVAQLERAWGRI